jgi:hypothetical protein
MGRHNGIWSKVHEPIWDHAKTHRAAAHLVEQGVPPEYAAQVIVGALQRVTCWALRDGDTGRTGELTDARLAVVAWPESAESAKFSKPSRTGAMIREALRLGGFLEGEGAAETIHDFGDHCRDILGGRDRKRARDAERREAERLAKEAEQAKKSPDRAADRPGLVRGPSPGGPFREAPAPAEAAAEAFPPPPRKSLSGPTRTPSGSNPPGLAAVPDSRGALPAKLAEDRKRETAARDAFETELARWTAAGNRGGERAFRGKRAFRGETGEKGADPLA